MRKIIIILLSILLVGCDQVQPVKSIGNSTSSPTPEKKEYTLDEKQIEQLNMVIYSGGFFDDVTDSTDEITYVIDNDTLLVTLSGEMKMDIKFTVDADAIYTYPLQDVEFTYTKKKQDKVASLVSNYTRTFNLENTRIRTTLTTSDNQEYKLIYNQTRHTLENNGTPDLNPGTMSFVDSLSTQMYEYYENTWNEIMLFDSYMQTLNKHISDIFNNNESYTFRNKETLIVDNRKLYSLQNEEKQKTNKQEFTETPIRTSFMSKFYYYEFNSDERMSTKTATPYHRTLFLFSFLTSSTDFTIDELATAFITVLSEYNCMGKTCNKSSDNSELTISQGTEGEGYYTVLTLDYFNKCIQDVFGRDTYSIDETKKLPSGIVQGKEEKTFVGEAYAGDGYISYYGSIYSHYKEDGIDYVTLTPYYALQTDGEGIVYDIYTTAHDKIGSGIKENNVYQFVENNKDSFLTWEIALTPGSNPDFYQVISYKLK